MDDNHDPQPPLKGDFVVYVEGYGVDDYRCFDHNVPGNNMSDKNYGSGWAMGDNARNRYCARGSGKVRHFASFDEAVGAIARQRRKYPKQHFQLIYCVAGRKWPVSFQDDAIRLDRELDDEVAEVEAATADLPRETDREYPMRDELMARFGAPTGTRLAEFLGAVQSGDFEAATARLKMSRTTAYRYRNLFVKAGFLQR